LRLEQNAEKGGPFGVAEMIGGWMVNAMAKPQNAADPDNASAPLIISALPIGFTRIKCNKVLSSLSFYALT